MSNKGGKYVMVDGTMVWVPDRQKRKADDSEVVDYPFPVQQHEQQHTSQSVLPGGKHYDGQE